MNSVALAIDPAMNPSEAPPGTDDLSTLLARAKTGDTAAFETIYCRHAGRVYAVCLRIAGDAAQAEDLVQESFVRAWQRLADYRGEAAFATWLHRIAVNESLQHLRRRKCRPEHLMEIESTPLEPAYKSETALGMDLERAIRRLPDKARAVLVLHDIEGYRHDEIAAMTGTRTGTSKAHLHRARTLLKAWLSS